jgi:hypothetical protein
VAHAAHQRQDRLAFDKAVADHLEAKVRSGLASLAERREYASRQPATASDDQLTESINRAYEGIYKRLEEARNS